MAPVSLLAIMIETSTVSGRSAAARAAGPPPLPGSPAGWSAPTLRRQGPAGGQDGRVFDGCGDQVAPACPGRATPLSARLSASEPPPVKTSRRAVQLRTWATWRRALSTAVARGLPGAWRLERDCRSPRSRKGQHRRQDLRIQRGGGVMVEIDRGAGTADARRRGCAGFSSSRRGRPQRRHRPARLTWQSRVL